MTLQQLCALATVAEMGSFTTASLVLGMTQSAVSHAIASLEAELGVTLLIRDRGGVRPTAIGKRVLGLARELLDRVEQIRQEAAAAVGLAEGKVRLGSFPSVTARFLPGLLREFQQRYPGITVVLFEGTDDEVREWIGAGTVDVGVVTLPIAGLDAVPVAQDEYLAVLPAAHPLASETTVRVEQLAREPFIMSQAGCEPVIRALFRQAKCAPRTQSEVRDMGTIVAMVQEGMGVSIMPEMSLPANSAGVRAQPLSPALQRRLALAVPSLQGASPAVRTFLQEARAWVERRHGPYPPAPSPRGEGAGG